MAMWMQQLIVGLTVGGCGIYAVRQAIQALRAGKGRFGACCAKGCGAAKSPNHPAKNAPRVLFLPVEQLKVRGQRNARRH